MIDLLIGYSLIGFIIAFLSHSAAKAFYRDTFTPVASFWNYLITVGLIWPLFLVWVVIRVFNRKE